VRLRYPPLFQGTLDIDNKSGGLQFPERARSSIYPDREFSETEGDKVFMPILKEFTGHDYVQFWGLVLKAAGQDQYRRVGAFLSASFKKDSIPDSGNEGKQVITII